jgi:hypothetical protein
MRGTKLAARSRCWFDSKGVEESEVIRGITMEEKRESGCTGYIFDEIPHAVGGGWILLRYNPRL